MRLRFIPEAKEIVERSRFVVHDPYSMRGKWRAEGNGPLHVEIGMGKGRFLIEMAQAHPEYTFLGIERYESVLFRACERMEGIPYHTPADQLERLEHPEMDEDLSVPQNVRFLSLDARELTDCFAPEEIDCIYLNFSDPWPKARHSKRRLTSHEFLARYEQVLADGGRIEFKTDNTDLFSFSVDEITSAPHFEITELTRDLHHDPELCRGNIMTEYERKFSKLGNKICKLTAVYHTITDAHDRIRKSAASPHAIGAGKRIYLIRLL